MSRRQNAPRTTDGCRRDFRHPELGRFATDTNVARRSDFEAGTEGTN